MTMDFKDFRRIVNRLFESENLWDEPAVEDLIERTLETLPSDSRSLIRDALDILKINKKLSQGAWVSELMRMLNTEGDPNANLSFEEAKAVVQVTISTFYGQVVTRATDDAGRALWAWGEDSPAAPREPARDPSRAEPAPLDPNNLIHSAALQQNEIMSTVRDRIAKMEYFNVGTIKRIMLGMNVPNGPMMDMLVQHFIDTHSWMFEKPDADGNYRVKPDPNARKGRGTTDYQGTFRGWADDVLKNPNDFKDEG
jgi:hypothetical protein